MVNEGIVIETTKKDAVVMTPEKGFVIIKNKHNYSEGSHIYFKNQDIINKNRLLYIVAPICASVAVFILAFLLFFKSSTDSNVYAYIHIDINPSVEMKVNIKNQVLDVNPINNDANKLLEDLILKGKPLRIAIDQLLQRAVELEFVSQDKNIVLFSPCIYDKSLSEDRLDSILAILNEPVLKINDINIESSTIESNIHVLEKSRSSSLSMGRFILYENLNNNGEIVSQNEVQKMPLKDLIEKLLKDDESDNNTLTPSPQVQEISPTISLSETQITPTTSPRDSVAVEKSPSPSSTSTDEKLIPQVSQISTPQPTDSILMDFINNLKEDTSDKKTSTPLPRDPMPDEVSPSPVRSDMVSTSTPSITPTTTPTTTTTTTTTPTTTPTIIPTNTTTTTPTTTPTSTLKEPNLIINGDFSNQLDGWIYKTGKGSKAELLVQDKKLNINVLEHGTSSSDVSLYSSIFSLVNGKKYIVRFEAYSSSNQNLRVNVTDKEPSWLWQAGQVFDITPDNREYFLRFTMKNPSSDNNSIVFVLEKPTSNMVLDNVRIYEEGIVQENWGVNILKNGNFTDKLEGWRTSFSPPAKGNLILENGAAKMIIENGGTEEWHAKLSTSPLNLIKGKTYTVEFEASSTVEMPAWFQAYMPFEPYEWYGGGNFILTPKRQKYSFSFKMTKETTNVSSLMFHMGGYTCDIYFYNIAVYEYTH